MLIFHQTASPPNNIKIRTPCQKSPLCLSPLHIFREPHKKNILCTFGNHTPNRPVCLRASNSETKGFRDLGPKPPIPLAFGVHLMQQQHNVLKRAEAQGKQGRMTGRSFSNGRLHKACTPQIQPALTQHTFQPAHSGL